MKVVSSQQMASIETEAYREGASESSFMDDAGSGISLAVYDHIEKSNLAKQVVLLCGKGNNAGDAYVAGINLLHLGYDVTALQLFPIETCSKLCQTNHQRFLYDGGEVVESLEAEDYSFPESGIIVDGIFGTGFYGKVDSKIAAVIQKANDSLLPIIAIDIPSGLNGETGEVEGTVIVASETAYLGLPKTGFFLLDGWNYVGSLTYVDFGLPEKFIEECQADLIMQTPDMLKPLMPKIKRNQHKYEAGYVVGLAGSPGLPGAAILAGHTALCSGAGIVRLLYPEGMESQLAHAPFELIKTPFSFNRPEDVIEEMNRATATFIGPGIGLTSAVRELLRKVLPSLTKPCVIDADALKILAEENIPLPKNVILTPHMGEIKRLLNLNESPKLTMAFLKTCQQYAEKNQATIVLKGGPSFIIHPDESIVVNPFGDPGMATAGSGDVLTGLLAALLAKGLSTKDAAALGTYLHAVAGEDAAHVLTSHCLIATDIINYLPEAFRHISSR